jgi:hypothetical protein
MKIAEYNQMMAYLTRPEPLPQPKPEELLDLQEQKRKDRLRKTMEEVSPFLEDESVDFIERNEMAIGGGLIQGEDLGTREGFRRPEDRVARIVDKNILERSSKAAGTRQYQVEISYIDPKLLKKFGYDAPRGEYVKKYTKAFNTLKEAQAHRDKIAYPKLAKEIGVDVDYFTEPSKSKSFARNVQEFLPKNKKGYITASQLAEELGEPEKFVTKAGPGRDSSFVKAVKKLLDQTEAGQFGFKGTPGQDFYVYKKPTPKEIELLKRYKTRQGSNLAGSGYNMVTPDVAERIRLLDKSPFFKNLMNSKKIITTDMLDNPNSGLNKFLKKNNMNFNQFLRASLRYGEAAKGDFLINVTDSILTDKPIAKNKKLSDRIYETFQNSITGKISDPIRAAVYRAAMADISDQLGQETTTFGNYKTYLRNRANKILGKGSGIDIDEIVGVSSSARNKTAPYAVFSRFVDEALNRGKLSSFQTALSNRTAKLRTAISKNDMKAADKIVKAFDTEIYKPYITELKAMGAKNVDLPRLTLSGPTSKTLGGGTGRIAELKAQGLDFDEFFKKEKFGYVMPKGSLTQKELLNLGKGKFKNLLNDVKKIGCPVGKADGGRIGFSEGLDCFNKGVKAINTGNIPEGAAKKNFINFANKAMAIGKQAGTGLRTITKFGIIPEAIIIAADTAIRAGMGDTLDEAFLRATDIYRTDDAYEQADASEIRRRDPANADIILNLRNFYNEQAKLSSLEQAKEADLALAGDDFAETNIGETEEEIEKRYAPQLQEQENNLFNASISDAEERAGLAKETEFADKKGVDYKKSFVGEILDVAAERPGIKQFADLFATGTRGEPDVSAQTLQNYLSGNIPQEEEKELQNIIDSGSAANVLDVMKKIEAAQKVPEGAIREPNVFDEERKILLDLAKDDTALAERLFGPSMTFAGDPIDSTDLQDEMNLDRGIYSLGGRIGFKDGPKNPGRRTFIKGMGILAALPFVGKFIKPAAKPIIQKLSNTPTVMPDWFPNFVEKFMRNSIGKKIDADLMEFKNADLPNVKVTRNDDGRVFVEGRNEYGEKYQIEYEPPGYELIDEKTGQAVRTPGNFEAVEGRHVALGPEDYDVDPFYADDLDELASSDIADMEKYTTGKVTGIVDDAFGESSGLKKGEYNAAMGQGKAEADADRALEDAAEFYDEID